MDKIIILTEQEYEYMARANGDVDKIIREVENRNWRENYQLENDRNFWKSFTIWLGVISFILVVFSLYLLYHLNK